MAKDQFSVYGGRTTIFEMPEGGITIRNNDKQIKWQIVPDGSGLRITAVNELDMSDKLTVQPACGNQIIIL